MSPIIHLPQTRQAGRVGYLLSPVWGMGLKSTLTRFSNQEKDWPPSWGLTTWFTGAMPQSCFQGSLHVCAQRHFQPHLCSVRSAIVRRAGLQQLGEFVISRVTVSGRARHVKHTHPSNQVPHTCWEAAWPNSRSQHIPTHTWFESSDPAVSWMLRLGCLELHLPKDSPNPVRSSLWRGGMNSVKEKT